MKRGRALLVTVLIAALLATGAVQSLALQHRRQLLKVSVAGDTSLTGMNSYALVLLLGGLRGPLVMVLWMQSESSKIARDIEGVETQIEWIRLLQPEFDTVHLFQIWNKAFNISAQIASPTGKYRAVLDALDYARNVNRQRPDNINTIVAIGNIYSDKLAGLYEHAYYDERVRSESKWRPADPPRAAGMRATRLPSMLNQDGTLCEQYVQPRLPHPPSSSDGIDQFYDGSELQFLKRYEPFRNGLTSRALAYNYLKRAQVLQETTGQRHLQISPRVVDSRPSLALKQWSYEQWDWAVAAEARLLGQTPVVGEGRLDALSRTGLVNPLASSSVERIKDHEADLADAQEAYARTLKLMGDSLSEFKRHLANPNNQVNAFMYQSHLDDLDAGRNLLGADLNVLKALRADPADRQQLLAAARTMYEKALRQYRIVRLRDFFPRELYGVPSMRGMRPENLAMASDAELSLVSAAADQILGALPFDPYVDDNREYSTYITRAQQRLAMLSQQQ